MTGSAAAGRSRFDATEPTASPRCADRTSTGEPAVFRPPRPERPTLHRCRAGQRDPRPSASRACGTTSHWPADPARSRSVRSAHRVPRRRTARCRRRSPRRGPWRHLGRAAASAPPCVITAPVSSLISGIRAAVPVRARRACHDRRTCATSTSSRSARSSRVSTAARSACEPTTTTRRHKVTSSAQMVGKPRSDRGSRLSPKGNTTTSSAVKAAPRVRLG